MRIFRQTRFAIILNNTICYYCGYFYTYKYECCHLAAITGGVSSGRGIKPLGYSMALTWRFCYSKSGPVFNTILPGQGASEEATFTLLPMFFYRSLPIWPSSLIAGSFFSVASLPLSQLSAPRRTASVGASGRQGYHFDISGRCRDVLKGGVGRQV